jgi:hypothetical protein
MRALLILLTASLVLVGCGSSRSTPLTGARLAAAIRSDGGMFVTPGWNVSCVRHACRITWKERVHSAHEGWLIAFPEVWSVDSEPHFVRHFEVRLVDTRTRTVTSFACERHKTKSAQDANSTPPRALGCVETQRDLV